jgi:ferrous iron transport protein A
MACALAEPVSVLASPQATHPAAEALDRLPVGATGTVVAVHGELSLRRRLLEMGLTTGATVAVVRRAPLGDPIELRVRGYNLSLRAEQARCVSVGRR